MNNKNINQIVNQVIDIQLDAIEKLNAGAEADPSGALLNKFAYVILLFEPVPPPLTSTIGNISVLAGAVNAVSSDIFLFAIIRI